MVRLFLMVFFLLLVNRALTQNLSLAEAIETGIKNRTELKTGSLLLQLEQQKNDKIKAAWMPQVSASGDFRYNVILQKSVLPIGEFGIPGVGQDVTTTVAFGVPFNTTVGVDVTQKLYDPIKTIDKKLNGNAVNYQLIEIEKQKKDIRYAITQAYYDVLFQKEKVKITELAVSRAQVNLENVKTRFASGTALNNDVDRLTLDLSNAMLAARKAQQDYAFAIDQLKFQMNVGKDTKVEISETIQTMLESGSIMEPETPSVNSAILKEQIAMNDNQLLAQKMVRQNAPTVSAYGNLSVLALNEDINPFSFVGIRASMPLYDGRQSRLAQQDYQIKQRINQLTIEQLSGELDVNIQSAKKFWAQAKLDLEEGEKNVSLARQVYKTDVFRFEKGNLVLSDLKNSEFTLQNTENNYLAAAYNYLMAALKLDKVLEK